VESPKARFVAQMLSLINGEQMADDKKQELGALWARTSKNGKPFLSGKINNVDVVCFKNDSENEKAPTWKVYKSEPRD
jgi:hypothetical protein